MCSVGCLELCNKDYQDLGKEYSYEQSIKQESFFVLACYFDEATLRHVHIQGRNKTKKTMTFATIDVAIHNRYKDRRYLLGYLLMFQFRI